MINKLYKPYLLPNEFIINLEHFIDILSTFEGIAIYGKLKFKKLDISCMW